MKETERKGADECLLILISEPLEFLRILGVSIVISVVLKSNCSLDLEQTGDKLVRICILSSRVWFLLTLLELGRDLAQSGPLLECVKQSVIGVRDRDSPGSNISDDEESSEGQ